MASVPVYCLCRLPYDVTRFMIECDICQDWFHGSCVGVEEDAAADIDLYHCPNCQLAHGPSVMKRRRGPQKQQDAGLSREAGATVRTGSAQFIKELRARTFPSADEVILKPSGAQLTVEFLEENSFSVPILVLKKDGLGMTLPPPSFTVRDIEHYVGPDKEIDVIDVSRQADLRMRLGDFVSYFGAARRDKVLNVISLEFSESRLSNLVETPKIVRKLSWVENLWPGESVFERPSVQKYCLMGTQGSYTDFHIDFGGTSVWYHVLWGEKIFYLVRPSPTNLARFEAWSSSSNQSETFFGDQAEHCYRCPLRQGQTLFIPTGWIHAVLTPIDCLAFGGNFLHSLNIEMQLKAYEIEKRLSTADLFRFPNFETICWYVGKHLLDIFRGLRENRRHPAAYLVHGAKALNTAFRAWTRREVLEEHEDEIPGTVRPAQLIKDLAKEIRLVEQNIGKTGSPFGVQRAPPPGTRRGDQSPQEPGRRGGRKGREGPAAGAPTRLDLELLDTCTEPPTLESSESPQAEEFDVPSSSLEETDGDSELAEGELTLVLADGRPVRPKRARGSGRRRPRPSRSPSPPSSPGAQGLDLDSEEDLQIDEAPPRKDRRGPAPPRRLAKFPRKLPRAKPSALTPTACGSLGRSSSTSRRTTPRRTRAARGTRGWGRGAARAGILDLLKASRQVGGPHYEELSEAPASPSTQEAIQGMLCMANLQAAGSSPGRPAWWVPGHERGWAGGSGTKRPRRRPPTRAPAHSTDSEGETGSLDEQESLGACFKDAEFIYPSLESDEDDPALKSLPKKKKCTDDAPWSPKGNGTQESWLWVLPGSGRGVGAGG
ncbi:histone lysine demethylase PHF8 isoform X2 [Chrysemys picta bellii]|uniref:histone lysine demethylase PHF8 isoform X2 n=1 Tax=Chrysemys picta bellii TaxID=8478 RepID=UPI0032B0F29D